MRRALNEYVVEGVKTNLPFLRRVLANERFRAGKYDTHLAEHSLADRPRAEAGAWTPSWAPR